jgi:hypothetical protein
MGEVHWQYVLEDETGAVLVRVEEFVGSLPRNGGVNGLVPGLWDDNVSSTASTTSYLRRLETGGMLGQMGIFLTTDELTGHSAKLPRTHDTPRVNEVNAYHVDQLGG